MTVAAVDKVFAGSIPQLYQSHFVPLIFQPYADDLARRLADRRLSRVLELAAGTGVATRALDQALDPDVAIVATDLNDAMIEEARAHGTRRAVEWRTADAMALPFPDASFDCVVCQFGVMFFPDKAHAFAEARRVLAPGGVLAFNSWDRIEDNEFADVVTESLAGLFPADPPRFMARTPHGYHDVDAIARDLAAGGFTAAPRIETIAARSIAPNALHPAIAYCQGSPLRSEIEARGSLEEATAVAARAIAARFGDGEVDGKIQAHVVMVER
ncbi:MAG TPA: class I SAM-dependent methyltransferase [Usitatibacter sp.]|nr:class I SAM-dependent methyltransferase [Usitatibacter sp.]